MASCNGDPKPEALASEENVDWVLRQIVVHELLRLEGFTFMKCCFRIAVLRKAFNDDRDRQMIRNSVTNKPVRMASENAIP